MKRMVLDSSVIITLASTCLLEVLTDLKKASGVQFVIPPGVESETVGKSLHIDRFMLEGIRVYDKIADGTIKVVDDNKVRELGSEILRIINNTFSAKGENIKLVHKGETELIALANHIKANFVGVDEKTTRILIETPEAIKQWMESKMHTPVSVDEENLKRFERYTKGLKVLRSSDIIAYAFKRGLFDRMIPPGRRDTVTFRENFVKGFLWALRFSGCAIRENEINEYLEYLMST